MSQRLRCNILYKSREKIHTVLTILLFIKFKNTIYIKSIWTIEDKRVIYYNVGTLMERINCNFFIRSVTIIIEDLFSSNRVIKFYNDIFNSV